MPNEIGYSLLWDDKNNDIAVTNGKATLTEEQDSVQEWLLANLGVELDKFDIYTGTDIGIPYRQLIGAKGRIPNATIYAVLEGAAEQTALACEAVERVDNMQVSRSGNLTQLDMEITSVYGHQEEAVNVVLE